MTRASERFAPFNAEQWFTDAWAGEKFDNIVVLRDPDVGCTFDDVTLLQKPADKVDPSIFLKLNLFVRLWRKLGWTIEETDAALQTFLPFDYLHPQPGQPQLALGIALKTALVYLAHLKELTDLLNVGKNGRVKVLTLWTNLPTQGKNSLYGQLFLTRNILKDDGVFDHPLGEYLSNSDVNLKDHLPVLQGALNMTADEIGQIIKDGNAAHANENERDVNTARLNLANVSLLYKYGLLAKALKLSIDELVSFKAFSGLNPFEPLIAGVLGAKVDEDYPLTKTLEFVRAVQHVKASGFTISDLDYLFRHRVDPLGNNQENKEVHLAWLRTLATELSALETDFAIPESADSVTDDVLRRKMSLIFPPAVVDKFMIFWLNKYEASKPDVSSEQKLDFDKFAGNGVSVSYDLEKKTQKLTFTGVLTEDAKTALLEKIPADNPVAKAAKDLFTDLLQQIVEKSSTEGKAFFNKYFDGLVKFADIFGGVVSTLAEKHLKLLENLLPYLKDKLNEQAIVRALTAQSGGDATLTKSLLTDSNLLALPEAPTIRLADNLRELNKRNISLTTFASETLGNPPKAQPPVEEIKLEGTADTNSARWQGYLEVPQSGVYRFHGVLGKENARVKLQINGVSRTRPECDSNTRWR